MSDLRLNIRFYCYHLQISNNWKFRISYNDYHKGHSHGRFAIYEFNLFAKNYGVRENSGSGD